MGSAWCFSTSTSLIPSLFLFCLVSSAQPLCHPDERSALLQFKQSLVVSSSASSNPEAYAKTESWGRGDCCSWDGVECDNITHHVVGLDLSSSYLQGLLNSNSSLFRLVHLQSLNLADNVFKDSKIPSEIRYLSKLTSLVLYYSNFTGHLPLEISELSELQILDLTGNPLKVGERGLRSLLEKLTNLKELSLADMGISSSVPNISPKFSSLTTLILSNCDLRGDFPPGIFELPNLQHLSLESNPQLGGYLPEIRGNHPLLQVSLAGTSFSGKLPESIGNLRSLSYLDINSCNFSGEVPYSLGNLTELTYLDMSFNNFFEPIPRSIGNLNQLTTLDLSNNKFSGEIPVSLANLTQITYLYLRANQLEGQIPPWIGNLTSLTEIKLQQNNLSGPIPESIFKLENLELLDLQINQLDGIIKLESFLQLKNLTRLQLSGNNLSVLTDASFNVPPPKFKLLALASCNLSKFPDFLRSQDELELLELADNKIRGLIPKWFWTVGKETLNYLHLGFNFLTGFEELPSVLPWTSIEFFSLESNLLQGSLPLPPPSIKSYLVSNNSLSGAIPPILCNLSSIEVLDLSSNNLTGMLPRCLNSLTVSLKVLNLRNNHFTGDIPLPNTKSCGLWMMDLSQNQLQGKIPRSLAHCATLESLNLGHNLINDTFPSWLGSLPKLKVLILRSNELSGVIEEPEARSEFSKLQVIDLSNNSFRGKLPSEYFNIWKAMQFANTNSSSPYMNANTSIQSKEFLWDDHYNYVATLANKGRDLEYGSVPDSISAIDLSSNKFEGEIPEAIGNLKVILILNLSNNNLKGHIPSSLEEISTLESLDLSRNKLSGKIPQKLANLNFLEHFNVSYNNLEGPIPRGQQFNTFNNDSYEGNSRLCGYPLSGKCGNTYEMLPPPPLEPEEDEGIASAFEFGWKIVLAGYGGGLIVGISLGYNFTPRRPEWFMKVLRRWPSRSNSNWNGSSWYGSFSFLWSKLSWAHTRS